MQDIITVGGEIDYDATDTNVTFEFAFDSVATSSLSVVQTKSDKAAGLVPLLFSLKHHVKSFNYDSGDQKTISGCTFRTSHGYMTCTTGNHWVMNGDLPDFTFDYRLGFYDCALKLSTLIAFESDWDYDPGYPTTSVGFVYICRANI
jgi:endoglucanase Acf2